MPARASSASMSAMAAINFGAGRWDRIEQIAWRGGSVSLAISAVITLAIDALGDLPLILFLPQSGPVLEHAREINYVVLWGWTALSGSL